MNYIDITDDELEAIIRDVNYYVKNLKDYSYNIALNLDRIIDIKKIQHSNEVCDRFNVMANKYGNVRTVFHGTPSKNNDNIISKGFKLSSVGVSTGFGCYGRGMYFANNVCSSLTYSCIDNKINRTFFLCRIVLGKTYMCDHPRNYMDIPLLTGYNSHSGKCTALDNPTPNAMEHVIFNEDQMIPIYLVTLE